MGPPAGFGPPPKKSKLRFLRILIPVLVLVVGGIFAVVNFATTPASSNAGDCLSITEFNDNADPAKAECGDPKANVKIAVKLDSGNDSCPKGDYDEYSVTGRSSYKLCLMINAKQGDCFANFTSKTAGYLKVPCSDPTKDAEFVKIVEGQADENICQGTDATRAAVYPQPATTMCVKSEK
ncbi:LppU/SCO3897 family protein [Amycolatopsis sp. H20-H5]|uniref:LppU/SCO3897 family protein n=1 Tax=Amycolatopsis sp. H20-H5 TaxID=3046309 RepID=UPI002DB8E497|nr:hypothetical protein [Amycolatopsis sp. H20-H5]MEC3981877.1 hypothetical protein [Amycolatopsis sp. H20-H5]